MKNITRQAVQDALAFSTALQPKVQPIVSFADDGELNLCWKSKEPDLMADVGFYGNGTYSYYARSAGKVELMRDDVPASEVSEDLISLLR